MIGVARWEERGYGASGYAPPIRDSPAGVGRWRGARCAAAFEDLDNDHAAAAARARRAMIGCGEVCIRCVARCRRVCRRARGGDKPSGARDIGLAASTGEQTVEAPHNEHAMPCPSWLERLASAAAESKMEAS